MSEQEYNARDLALCIEINEAHNKCIAAERELFAANIEMQKLNKERIVLRQCYLKHNQGGQSYD